jgi:hypothetical protein
MPSQKSEKPAIAATVNGLRFGQLGSVINQESKPTYRINQQTALRLRSLVEQIYPLGQRPFFELLAEIVGGAPPMERIERYARLNRERGDFIRANGGDQFPPRLFIINENDSR